MADVLLKAELRTELGKGSSRRARREGKIPAVLYGHGQEPVHIELLQRDYQHAIKHGINTLISIDVEGKKSLVLTKAIQRNALKRSIDHVDMILVRRGEKVHVEVRVVLVGEAEKGSLVNHELATLSIEAAATNIPEQIEVSIEGMQIGEHVTAKDVPLPEGATLVTEPDASVLGIMASPTAEQMEASGGETEEAAEGDVSEGETAEVAENGETKAE